MIRIPTLLITLSGLLAACTTLVDVELPDSEPRLVVNGLFLADTIWAVEVSRSFGGLEPGNFTYVEDATVEVLQDGAVVSTLSLCEREGVITPQPYGLYCAPERPVPGRSYTLRVAAPGYASVTATDYAPPPVPFTVEADTVRVPHPGEVEVELTLRFTDPAEAGDFYALDVLSRRRQSDGSIQEFPMNFDSNSALLLDGNYDGVVSTGSVPAFDMAWFRDTAINGTTQEVKISVRLWNDGAGQTATRYFVRLYAISEAYYNYLRSRRPIVGWDYDLENPFAEPVHVFNNIEHGFGIFAGASLVRRELR